MKFFSAIGKAVAHLANDIATDHQRKKAKQVAYKNTGKQIQKAKRQKTRINGSLTYKKELAQQTKRIQRRHDFVDDVIDNV